MLRNHKPDAQLSFHAADTEALSSGLALASLTTQMCLQVALLPNVVVLRLHSMEAGKEHGAGQPPLLEPASLVSLRCAASDLGLRSQGAVLAEPRGIALRWPTQLRSLHLDLVLAFHHSLRTSVCRSTSPPRASTRTRAAASSEPAPDPAPPAPQLRVSARLSAKSSHTDVACTGDEARQSCSPPFADVPVQPAAAPKPARAKLVGSKPPLAPRRRDSNVGHAAVQPEQSPAPASEPRTRQQLQRRSLITNAESPAIALNKLPAGSDLAPSASEKSRDQPRPRHVTRHSCEHAHDPQLARRSSRGATAGTPSCSQAEVTPVARPRRSCASDKPVAAREAANSAPRRHQSRPADNKLSKQQASKAKSLQQVLARFQSHEHMQRVGIMCHCAMGMPICRRFTPDERSCNKLAMCRAGHGGRQRLQSG
jgi:hypothetical protein